MLKFNLRKRAILSLFVLSISAISLSFGQTDWNFYREINGVKIYTQSAECKPEPEFNQERLLFKFENTNPYKIALIWDFQLHNAQGCYTCNDPDGERHHVLELKAGGIIEGKCLDNKAIHLGLFVQFNDPEYTGDATQHRLSHFEMANMQVVKMTNE